MKALNECYWFIKSFFIESVPKESKIVYKTETLHSKLKVVDITWNKKQYRVLISSGTALTMVEKTKRPFLPSPLPQPVFHYVRQMLSAYSMKPGVKKILALGVGGGTMVMELSKKTIVDAVELDPEVIAIAKKYFGLKESKNLHLFIDDGRYFLLNSKERYDLVFLDATPFPPHMFTLEMFKLVKTSLSEGGIFILNTFDVQNKEKRSFVPSVNKTLEKVFSHVYIGCQEPGKTFNTVFFASETELKSNKIKPGSITDNKNGVVITDDFNPVKQFYIKIREEEIKTIKKFFGEEILSA